MSVKKTIIEGKIKSVSGTGDICICVNPLKGDRIENKGTNRQN